MVVEWALNQVKPVPLQEEERDTGGPSWDDRGRTWSDLQLQAKECQESVATTQS